jgi:hypothetical protein
MNTFKIIIRTPKERNHSRDLGVHGGIILWRVRGTWPLLNAKMWRVRVLETPFGLLLRFIYDFTSRHYNYLYNVTLFTSLLILYLGWSSDCWLLGCCSNLTPLISSWHFISDRLLWSALTLRLWAAPLICSDVASLIGSLICSDVSSLIGSFDQLLTLRLWSTPLI